MICWDSLDEKDEHTFTCPTTTCKSAYCTSCLTQVLLSQKHTIDVYCLKCNTKWTKTLVLDSVPGDDTLRVKRRRIEETVMMLEQERLEPYTAHVAASAFVELDKIDTDIDMLRTKLLLKRDAARGAPYRDTYVQESSDLRSNIGALMLRKKDIRRRLATTTPASPPLTFPCSNQSCRGWVGSVSSGRRPLAGTSVLDGMGAPDETSVCDMCGTQTCMHCREACGAASEVRHVCKEDELASRNLIQTSTQACPDCNASVEKVEGTCNDMFCTRCTSEFNFLTGVKTSRVNHQPEKESFLKGGGSLKLYSESSTSSYHHLEDFPTTSELYDLFHRFDLDSDVDDHASRMLMTTFRRWSVVLEAHHLTTAYVPLDTKLVDLCLLDRVDYMRGKIDKQEFTTKVYNITDHQRMCAEVHAILSQFIRGSRDIFNQLAGTQNKVRTLPVKRFMKDLDAGVIAANKQLLRVSKVYNASTPLIPEQYKHDGSAPRITAQMWS